MNFDRNGIIGTLIYHGIIAILLIFFGFSYPNPPPEEEGILVNFGTDFTGFGDTEPAGENEQAGDERAKEIVTQTEDVTEEVAESVPETSPPVSAPERVEETAQNFEESPVKENKPSPEEIRQQEIAAERERQKKLEEERIRKEEERKRQEELERQRIQQERDAQAAKLRNMGKNAFGNKGVGTGDDSQGIAGGEGNQGSPGGTAGVDNYGPGGGLGNGISFGLGNRRGRGSWPKPVLSNCEVTSRIVIKVQIDVDSEGNVVGSPRVIESTYQDDCIYTAVLRAAGMAKFTSADQHKQRGWIKYIIEP